MLRNNLKVFQFWEFLY